MSRPPSQAVIEAVELSMRERLNLPGPMRHIFGDEVGDALKVLLAQEVQAAAPEIARAAEQAADERWMRWLIEHLHYGIDTSCEVDPPCTLAAYAALWERIEPGQEFMAETIVAETGCWADELTDTDDRSK